MTKIQKIELALSKGKMGGAKALLKELLLQEDKDKFYTDMRGVYDELYPKYRDMTDDEWSLYIDGMTETELNNVSMVQVEIDYSEDENYLSFEDYKNETKVITEAIAEELDEDGNVLTEAVEEITEQVRPYVAVDVTDRVNEYPLLVESIKIQNNLEKKEKINNIIVTVSSGVRLYADPISRCDIADVVVEAMENDIADDFTVAWKTADGIKDVSIADFREARSLGLRAKATIIGVS